MRRRLDLVFVFFVAIFLLVLVKLFSWQIVSFDRLVGMAERQRLVTLPIPASRGRIFASDGSPLVINQRAFGIYLEPKKIQDKEKTVSILSKELDIPSASISAKLMDDSLIWIPLVHKIEEQKAESLKDFKLPGVEFIEEAKRFYPESSMAAHLIGFVGKNTKGEDQGYFGIEGYYDEQLRGRDGVLHQEMDALGNPILTGERQKVSAENGRDIILYLDKTVQYIVETKLREGIEKYGAKGGTVVVLDPATGGVLAMVSFPSYDPSEFYDYPTEYYKNPAVSLSFEPGSSFKTLVMAIALNEGKVTKDTKYSEEGPIEIGGYSIKTWNQEYHGEISLAEVLKYSSNVGMVYVASQLPKETFFHYLENMGLGNPTGVDLQEEDVPLLRPKNKWYEIDYATASFGQGIAVTPLQMARAVSAIANGGKLMVPHVVKAIHLPNGQKIDIEPRVERVLFKGGITRLVAEMMVSAVSEGETRFIKPARYRVAGKTGTAQIPIAGHYDEDKTIASFVGFTPADSPKFLMLVTLHEPTASPWGSETAAPLFFSITKELFSYYGISPSD